MKKGCGWEERGDLPRGWMHKVSNNEKHFKFDSFLSPEGKCYHGCHRMFKHFKNLETVDSDDLEKVQFLHKYCN